MLISRKAMSSRRAASVLLAAAGMVMAVTSWCPHTWAQGEPGAAAFTWDTVDPAYADRQAWARQRVLIMQVLGGQQGFEPNRAAVDGWYRKNLFAEFGSRDGLGDLPEIREAIYEGLTLSARNPGLHQFLVDLAYEEATKRVTGNYHPAVKYNALLIIGDLNQTESGMEGTAKTPPVRLARALDFLVEELKKPNQLDALRLAAMVGIKRHVQLSRQRPADAPIPDARKLEIITLAQAMMNEKTPPTGRTPDGHAWLRGRAIELLAAAGAVGDNLAIFNGIVAVLDDADAPLSLRCTAARALQQLDYTGVTGIDPVAIGQRLAALAVFACRNEDERVKEEKKLGLDFSAPGTSGYPGSGYPGSGYPGGFGGPPGGYGGSDGGESSDPYGGGGYPGSGYPGGGAGEKPAAKKEAPVPEPIQRVRRRLKEPLKCVLLGLRGETRRSTIGGAASGAPALEGLVALAPADPAKDQVQKLVTAVEAIVTATDTFDKGLDDMMKGIRSKARELESLLPKPAEETEESSEDDALPGGTAPAKSPPAEKDGATKN
ncbi:MAG: hypothetical protein FJ276_04500 [Planctomycetes bacterium]|nr:hypothetical protein [Planctomycetota bacterium]